MNTVYETENVKIVELVDDEGQVQRQLLLGPPFENVQGAIKKGQPKFHIQEFTKNLTFGALCITGEVRSALFLGLGAGVVVQAVRDLFPAASIDIVDLNTELFSISNEFFFQIDSQNVRWFCEDASAFVGKADKKYDYICCDIWGHHLEVPQFVVESEFIARIKRIMSDQGVFAVNTQWFLHKRMSESLLTQFELVLSLRGFNCVLLAMDRDPKWTSDEEVVTALLSNNLDLRAIRSESILIRPAVRTHFA